jgi:hypothetical protein
MSGASAPNSDLPFLRIRVVGSPTITKFNSCRVQESVSVVLGDGECRLISFVLLSTATNSNNNSNSNGFSLYNEYLCIP